MELTSVRDGVGERAVDENSSSIVVDRIPEGALAAGDPCAQQDPTVGLTGPDRTGRAPRGGPGR